MEVRLCWRHQWRLFLAAFGTLLDLTGRWYPIFAERVMEEARQCPRCTMHGQGCDCTELCSMGPTCPGGMLARLPGSGCWRTEEEQ